jgi:hypothetical protein
MARNHATKLDAFLKANGVKPSLVARDAGVSRQHLYHLRIGAVDPTRHVMVALATACRRIMRRPVRVADLFDLGEELSIVAIVTTEQGRAFADLFVERARQTEIPDEAFAAAHVMTWPYDNPEAQVRFDAIMSDILAGFWTAIREPVAEAFVEAANYVVRRTSASGPN